jgi:hypothetical protein
MRRPLDGVVNVDFEASPAASRLDALALIVIFAARFLSRDAWHSRATQRARRMMRRLSIPPSGNAVKTTNPQDGATRKTCLTRKRVFAKCREGFEQDVVLRLSSQRAGRLVCWLGGTAHNRRGARVNRWQGCSFIWQDAKRANRRRKQFAMGKTPVAVRAKSAMGRRAGGLEVLQLTEARRILGRNPAGGFVGGETGK